MEKRIDLNASKDCLSVELNALRTENVVLQAVSNVMVDTVRLVYLESYERRSSSTQAVVAAKLAVDAELCEEQTRSRKT